MNIIKFALNSPVKIFVAVMFIFLFGLQAFINMPYQLSPSVEYPTITVYTSWTGATPYEIEKDVVEKQEKVLKSLSGLQEMESTSSNGRGSVTLQFKLGTNLMDAVLLVSNKLNEVRSYPENVQKPVIRATGADSSPVVYMLLSKMPGNNRDIDSYRTFLSEDIIPVIERVEGVSDIFFYGGRSTQMQVTIYPEKLAAYNVSIEKLVAVFKQENVDISGGMLSVGRKNYRVRTVSKYNSIDDIKNTLVTSNEFGQVKISDLADVDYAYAKADSQVMDVNGRTMMIGVLKEEGGNVIKITDDIEKVVNELNKTRLADNGVQFKWVYDQRPYINGAINLVKGNILVGGLLAIIVLLLFLRSISATMVIATAIPISVVGTFFVLNMLNRTLNVISLAGIAFAVGMLIDNAIVVLENIDRHSKMGKSPMQAAYDGAVEVWGAVLASTLTTVAVFLPVVFVKEESGQLFRDIAIAISCAVSLSLVVSILVIPLLTRLLFQYAPRGKTPAFTIKIENFGHKASGLIMSFFKYINCSFKHRMVFLVSLILISVLIVVFSYPKMEYLPQGNMNMVQSNFVIPSGLSLEERTELGQIFMNKVKPHIGKEIDGNPAVKDFFFAVFTAGMFATATSEDPERAAELVPLMTKYMRTVPGTAGFTTQSGIFQNRSGGGRSLDLVVSGLDLDNLIIATNKIIKNINGNIENIQVRARPNTQMMYPEANIVPAAELLKEVGLNASALGTIVDVYTDGRVVGEYSDKKLGNIDMIVTTETEPTPEQLLTMPVILPNGNVVPLSNVADLRLSYGMDGIRHYERERAFIVSISPPADVVLEQLMDTIQNDIVAPLKNDGSLDGINIKYSGSASKLTQAKNALAGNFIMASLITFLLMVALFNNFLYPLIIMFTVPLALAGGFLGYKAVDVFITPQSFDILTMLGFVILIGVVVNNAILIVHQALNNINMYGMVAAEAVKASVESRIRPIMMSAATSVFGMMPLVLFPGPGSELYRGLGSVVLGGLAFSTVFTIFMIPVMLNLIMKNR